MKVVITFNEVIELNKLAEEQKLPYRIHLRDTCNAQSLWIEDLKAGAPVAADDDMRRLLEGYFGKQGIKVRFGTEKDFPILLTK
jgi:hypothetical protein